MIDERKNNWDYPKELHKFIDLLEKDGFTVTYKKQNNSKSWLEIEKDGITMEKIDFSHEITSGEKYYKYFVKTMWPTYVKYCELKGE